MQDNNNNNEELEIIELEDSEGGVIKCIALGTFEMNDTMYCAFVEVDEAGVEGDDVIILRAAFADESKEMLDLDPIADDAELEAAYQEFLKITGAEDAE